MKIQITTNDTSLFYELEEISMGDSTSEIFQHVLIGKPTKLPKDISALHIPDIITFAVTLGTSIAVNLFSTWLYDKLKGRSSKLKIENQETKISITEIKKIIHLHINLKD